MTGDMDSDQNDDSMILSSDESQPNGKQSLAKNLISIWTKKEQSSSQSCSMGENNNTEVDYDEEEALDRKDIEEAERLE
jgi:hypothetical protein